MVTLFVTWPLIRGHKVSQKDEKFPLLRYNSAWGNHTKAFCLQGAHVKIYAVEKKLTLNLRRDNHNYHPNTIADWMFTG